MDQSAAANSGLGLRISAGQAAIPATAVESQVSTGCAAGPCIGSARPIAMVHSAAAISDGNWRISRVQAMDSTRAVDSHASTGCGAGASAGSATPMATVQSAAAISQSNRRTSAGQTAISGWGRAGSQVSTGSGCRPTAESASSPAITHGSGLNSTTGGATAKATPGRCFASAVESQRSAASGPGASAGPHSSGQRATWWAGGGGACAAARRYGSDGAAGENDPTTAGAGRILRGPETGGSRSRIASISTSGLCAGMATAAILRPGRAV